MPSAPPVRDAGTAGSRQGPEWDESGVDGATRPVAALTHVANSGNVTLLGTKETNAVALKPVRWMGSSRADLQVLPQEVRRRVGYALYFAQRGEKHEAARVLKGFGDAAVLEVVEKWDRSTYRAIYTVRLAAAVYVLHVFNKKSKRGAATPARDLALIERCKSNRKLGQKKRGQL